MRLYASKEERTRLASELPGALTPDSVHRGVELAWYERQCDPARAQALTGEARRLLEKSTASSARSLLSRLDLIETEHAWLEGAPAQAHAAPRCCPARR